MRMGDTYSPKQEYLQIIDEATWGKCQETFKGRATYLKHEMKVPERTDTRSLLSGLIFCADCGSRLTFSHNTTRWKLADGTVKLYERDLYRCYRKISSRNSCTGQSAYDINRAATEARVEQLLTWAGQYDKADYEQKHMIIAALIDRVEVGRGYEVSVHFKVMAEEILPGQRKSA